MGKNLIQQARGAGGPRYRAPSFRYAGRAEHHPLTANGINGRIVDFIKCPGHSAPLARVKYDDNTSYLMIASEGLRKGALVKEGKDVDLLPGNTLPLGNVPDGALVYNIEGMPGDGGKFCRSSGTFAKVLSHMDNNVMVELPSKKQRAFNFKCRANIGVIAGGGRTEKPLLKAGTHYYKKKAKNKMFPVITGAAQNAVDHPFGNKRTSRKSKARPVSRDAPPGRKVGMIAARRTGRKVHKVKAE